MSLNPQCAILGVCDCDAHRGRRKSLASSETRQGNAGMRVKGSMEIPGFHESPSPTPPSQKRNLPLQTSPQYYAPHTHSCGGFRRREAGGGDFENPTFPGPPPRDSRSPKSRCGFCVVVPFFVPSFRFFGAIVCTLVPVLGVQGTSAQTTLWKPPFCEPPV